LLEIKSGWTRSAFSAISISFNLLVALGLVRLESRFEKNHVASRRSRPSSRLSLPLARLTLYCGRIYEIKGDDIPPSTYARTCRALLRRASRRRFNMVNLLDLSACPYLPRPPSPPRSSYLRHASSTNRRPGQDVAFRFVSLPFFPARLGEPLATVCLHGAAIAKQSIPDNVPKL